MTNVVNTGSTPNDGTGDTLRDAMIKINARFLQFEGNVDINQRYQGAASSDPTTRLTGDALQNGDWYLNTSLNKFKTRVAGSWVTCPDILEADIAAELAQAKAGATAPGAQPAMLEQHYTGFFGRGMLTGESINTATEQAITASAAAGATQIVVTTPGDFQLGAGVVIKHSAAVYGGHIVTGKTGSTLDLAPPLRAAVTTSSKIERTWYNRAHPGKFYMRWLAQRLAALTEYDGALPAGGRVLYTNFASDPNTLEDTLAAVGGGAVYYFSASNLGSSADTTTPVRFSMSRSAYVEVASTNDGAQTALGLVTQPGWHLARVLFSASNATTTYAIQVLNSSGTVLGSTTVGPSVGQIVIAPYTVAFHSGQSQLVRVRVIATASAAGNFRLQQVDVFPAPRLAGKVLSKPAGKIVVLGDSWVAGDTGTTAEREPITTQLATELPLAIITNAGVGGNTIYDMWARFDTDVTPYNPDIVIVVTGTNEAYNPLSATFDPTALDEYTRYLQLVVGKCQAIGARALLVGPPALAQSDADTALAEWTLNNRAMRYEQAFFEAAALRPLVYGARTGIVVARSDLTLTTGATPSVANAHRITVTYGSATTITSFADGVKDQLIEIHATNGNVTLEHGTLILTGSTNITLTANSFIALRRGDPAITSAWYEVSRSIK